MRTAAYCSECKGYVWLDPRGDCIYGHPSYYLRDAHQAENLPTPLGKPPESGDGGPSSATAPTAPHQRADLQPPTSDEASDQSAEAQPQQQHPDPPYPPYGYGQQYPGQYAGQYPGQGPMPGQPYPPDPGMAQAPLTASGLPAGVPRFNWGAFLLPVIWPLVYGVPIYAGIALIANILANATTTFVPILGLPVSLAALGVDIWVGFAAHKAFWKKYPNKMSVEEYRAKQVKWAVIGAVLLILLFGCGMFAGLMEILGEDPSALGL